MEHQVVWLYNYFGSKTKTPIFKKVTQSLYRLILSLSKKKKKKKRLGESGHLRPSLWPEAKQKFRFFDGEWSMHTCHFMSAIFLYYTMQCKAVLR